MKKLVRDEQEFNAPSHEESSAPNANLQLNIRGKIDIAFAIDGDIRGSAPRVRAAVGSSTKGGDRPPPLLTLYRKGNSSANRILDFRHRNFQLKIIKKNKRTTDVVPS